MTIYDDHLAQNLQTLIKLTGVRKQNNSSRAQVDEMSLFTNKTENTTTDYVKPALLTILALANVQSMWFDSEISDQAVTPSRFHVFCQDRKANSSKHRGLCYDEPSMGYGLSRTLLISPRAQISHSECSLYPSPGRQDY